MIENKKDRKIIIFATEEKEKSSEKIKTPQFISKITMYALNLIILMDRAYRLYQQIKFYNHLIKLFQT